MNAKAKGTRREHQTMRLLESIGYSCTRAAASLGEWDVIAIHPTHVRLIQVKSNRRPGPAEMSRLGSFGVPSNVSREIWVWIDREKYPHVEVL